MVECHWKSTFGINCPGCGFQRSLELLFQRDIWGSIVMYPATIPLLITLIYTVLHLQFKFRKGARWIVILFSFTALLMLVNFIIKLPYW